MEIMFEQSAEVQEIYKMFEKLGFPPPELDRLFTDICIDRKKTEAILSDLALCVLIKNGFKLEHLKRLSIKLLPRRCRAKRLEERIRYLSRYIVKKE